MKTILLACAVALSACLSAPSAPAQCLNFGRGCPGSFIQCGTHPRIGTTWLVCNRRGCTPTNNVILFGACSPTPVRIPAVATCLQCPTCFLDVWPVFLLKNWSGISCFGIGIPRDSTLIGASLCVQNACVFRSPACVCLSNTIRATFIR